MSMLADLKSATSRYRAQLLAGATFLFALIAIFAIAIFDSWTSDFLRHHRFSAVTWLPEPTAKDIHYCQSWFLASLAVNAISILSALVGLYWLYPRENRSPAAGFGLGLLFFGNVYAMTVVRYHSDLIPTYTTLAIFVVYCLIDLGGIFSAAKANKDSKPFKLPFFFIDLPSLIITLVFIYYGTHHIATTEFFAGSIAGVVLSSNLIYIALSGLIFQDDKVQEATAT